MVEFLKMSTADIAAGLRLCREANWNQLSRDWEMFLQNSPHGCAVAISGDTVVGTVTTIIYPGAFSWIGMVLVDKAFQRQGIGLGLLKEALRLLQDENTVKLDATPAGREVYLKLGFSDEYRLSRMIGQVDHFDWYPESDARSITALDWPLLSAFDQLVFGADRQSLLEWIFTGAPELAHIKSNVHGVQGFCFGRPGQHYHQIGPVVAINASIAKELVSVALKQCKGKTVIIDAMHFDKEWLSWLESIGFKEQRPFIRMYRGSNQFIGLPENQFAITGPEFG